MIYFLLSFLGILSVWSNILQEVGNCTKEKNLSSIIKEKFKLKILMHRCIEFWLRLQMLSCKISFNFQLNVIKFVQHRFLSLVQVLSSCKILDKTNKMPGNESKLKIMTIKENTFPI